MRSIIRQEALGVYYADFNLGEAPRGFEDCFLTSMTFRRFKEGRAFAELGHPNTDNLTGDPQATLRRVLCIEDRNICAHLDIRQLDPSGEHIRIYVKPYGPLRDKFQLLLNSGAQFALEFRIIHSADPDDEDEQIIVNIPSVDVIQI